MAETTKKGGAGKSGVKRAAAKKAAAKKTARAAKTPPVRMVAGKPSRRGPQHEKAVNIALQGGGAHGAFTWGVLDRLFEDDRIWIEAISGTSAGAMNAVVAAMGMRENGAVGARERLREF